MLDFSDVLTMSEYRVEFTKPTFKTVLDNIPMETAKETVEETIFVSKHGRENKLSSLIKLCFYLSFHGFLAHDSDVTQD